jgi:hypothetical protein
MTHDEMMKEAAKLVAPRGNVYGDIRTNHEQIAKIATQLTGIELSAHDILMIMVSVKLSRIAKTPDHVDSYLDALNYLSFAGEIATDGGSEG